MSLKYRFLGGLSAMMIIAGGAHAQTPWLKPERHSLPPIVWEWYTYRHTGLRTGVQPYASDLSNPAKVRTLDVRWRFPADGQPALSGGFRNSPIVANDTVFVGGRNGYFYAIDAATGVLKWQYPKPADPPLLAEDRAFRYGFEASASYWYRGEGVDGIVVFGAQDPSLGPAGPHGSYGSARIFALNAATGAVVWKSPPIATIDGTTRFDRTQRHERIAHSPTLLFDNKVYLGIHNRSDDPIQVGRVVALDLATGQIHSEFKFRAVGTEGSPPGTRGGAVWNAPAADSEGVYFTTGNTRCDSSAVSDPATCQAVEPKPNHGLSMIRVNKDTGDVIWEFQPVPYDLDKDPDWAAGAAVMYTSCGELIASVQKDGWSYAVDAGNGTPGAPAVRWQFPPTGFPFTQYVHSDDDYKRPGAAWNDVLIVVTGGENVPQDVAAGYGKLHALNVCEKDEKQRVRWIADIPGATSSGYALGAPTVTGGIVYIGTDQGHLVVLADPSIVPAAGWRCSNIHYATPADCTGAGYVVVPQPTILKDIVLPDAGNIAGLREEPVLAKGRVFVATGEGHVYMLAP
jgi:outer membrane protein assembly factor BamB